MSNCSMIAHHQRIQPSGGAKSKSNRLLVTDNLVFLLEGRFASSIHATMWHAEINRKLCIVTTLSPMHVSLEIDVLLATVEASTLASLVRSGSHRPCTVDAPSAPGQ